MLPWKREREKEEGKRAEREKGEKGGMVLGQARCPRAVSASTSRRRDDRDEALAGLGGEAPPLAKIWHREAPVPSS